MTMSAQGSLQLVDESAVKTWDISFATLDELGQITEIADEAEEQISRGPLLSVPLAFEDREPFPQLQRHGPELLQRGLVPPGLFHRTGC